MYVTSIPLVFIWAGLAHAVLQYSTTPNGFSSQPKGWNSFALSAVKQLEYNQENVIKQCDAMASSLGDHGYKYCSLDSGWSLGVDGDEYGRITYDKSNGWDMPALAEHLHSNGMYLGIYIVPGFFHNDVDKYIHGTDPKIQLSSISDGNCQALARCQFNFSAPGVQEYCNSNVDLWAEWGVDFIKLDFVTPGSPQSGTPLDPDASNVVVCYHRAIKQSGRQMRLDISWKLDWQDEGFYDRWSSNADSMRIDQDINNASDDEGPQVSFKTAQRTIEQYRQYISTIRSRTDTVTIYPDLDNLLVGNDEDISGLTDAQRGIVYSHWIGAGANLILGSDMTKLDDLGRSMLTSSRWNTLADEFTSKFPMRPLNGNDDSTHGKQIQLWLAGPNAAGQALIVWVNYGRSNLDLYSGKQFSGVVDDIWSNDHMKANGLTEECYSAINFWNPGDEVNLKNFSSLKTELDEEEALVLFLTPNKLAIYCDVAVAEV